MRWPVHPAIVATVTGLLLTSCASDKQAVSELDAIAEFEGRAYVDESTIAASEIDTSTLDSELGKADEAIPVRFDVLSEQTPVRDQGRRGACATFTATAIAEFWHRRLNTMPNPDFSEQYLFWQTHNLINSAFDYVSSTTRVQLDSIEADGITTEGSWPYEGLAWNQNTSAHPQCNGYTPLSPECYTNGAPSDLARTSPRYFVSNTRAIRLETEELKAYIVHNAAPVGVGVRMLDSSWRGVHLYDGIVTVPSGDTPSTPRKGHEVLVVGWDDDMVGQRLDRNGEPEFDSNGEPVLDRGFFLFKNSWGTRGWGRDNSRAPGYGWMSYRYWSTYAYAAAVASPPSDTPSRAELCTNGLDDNHDGAVDCDDAACFSHSSCASAGSSLISFHGPVRIEDNDTTGVTTRAVEENAGSIVGAALAISITHPYIGDIEVSVIHPSGFTSRVRYPQGGSTHNLSVTLPTHAFDGLDAAGSWGVLVRDLGRGDSGTLDDWSLTIQRCVSACAEPKHNRSSVYYDDEVRAIPDNDETGIESSFTVGPGGLVTAFKFSINIEHENAYDLEVTLTHEGGRAVTVVPFGSQRSPNLLLTDFNIREFVGENPYGRWRIRVRDRAAIDTGRLLSTSFTITRN